MACQPRLTDARRGTPAWSTVAWVPGPPHAAPILLGVQPIDVVVETSRGSRNKYEIDEQTGLVRLERRLPGAFAFPAVRLRSRCARLRRRTARRVGTHYRADLPGVRVWARPIGVFWILARHHREAKLPRPRAVTTPAGLRTAAGIRPRRRASAAATADDCPLAGHGRFSVCGCVRCRAVTRWQPCVTGATSTTAAPAVHTVLLIAERFSER